MGEEAVKKLTFNSVAGVIGAVSGVLGIVQSMRDMGGDLVKMLWDGLYYLGYVAVFSWIAYCFIGAVIAKLASMATGKGTLDEHMRTWKVLLPCLLIGAWAGIALGSGAATVKVGTTEPIAFQPFDADLMRAVGAAAILLPLTYWWASSEKKAAADQAQPPQ